MIKGLELLIVLVAAALLAAFLPRFLAFRDEKSKRRQESSKRTHI